MGVLRVREVFAEVVKRAASEQKRTIAAQRAIDLADAFFTEDLRLLERLASGKWTGPALPVPAPQGGRSGRSAPSRDMRAFHYVHAVFVSRKRALAVGVLPGATARELLASGAGILVWCASDGMPQGPANKRVLSKVFGARGGTRKSPGC